MPASITAAITFSCGGAPDAVAAAPSPVVAKT